MFTGKMFASQDAEPTDAVADVDEESDKNKAFLKALGVDHVTEVDAEGHDVKEIDTADVATTDIETASTEAPAEAAAEV
eukprot:NODE_8879_length_391_cov_23.836257_g7991_i0.p1 GENE.NODE_8879_length_391_cov_23.836257_g7991_i0~~NODE_8879_length_391_cov_23.836257_g7991_i0.p1  ORF type:complete len:79 (+),score=20.66 NODE_8879_length_391_cov_23.836257_g7991_i0:122-358(+)